MEISRRYKIYIAIIIAVAITLTLRWGYYHNRWRTIEMPKDGYRISYPAYWFNSTHKAIRGPVGKWTSLEVTNFPFVNSIMVRVYVDEFVHPSDNDVTDWALEIIKKDGCETWSLPQQIQLPQAPSSGMMTECIDDVGYHCKIVAFAYDDRIYAVELLTFKKQWQKGNSIFERILSSFEIFE